ncbi:MAG: hypothetical protein AAF761_12110 [Pseudomonadota bacterium]
MSARQTLCITATLIAATAATPALADDCEVERDALLDALARNGFAVEAEGTFSETFGRCRIRDMVVAEPALTLDIGMLEWDLEGLAALDAGAGSASLNATLDNLRMIPGAEDPWIGYMLREQNRRNTIDGTLSVSWDMDTGRFELEALTLDLPGDNALSLAIRAGGLPPQILAGGVANAAAAAVEGMELVVTNTGFADGLILSALGGAMSGLPGTPERQMAATRRDARTVVEDLPDTLLDAGSKAALGALIDDAPVPWGTLAITLAADPALPFLRFPALALSSNPFDPAALGFAFDGAKIDIRFDPAPDPE